MPYKKAVVKRIALITLSPIELCSMNDRTMHKELSIFVLLCQES